MCHSELISKCECCTTGLQQKINLAGNNTDNNTDNAHLSASNDQIHIRPPKAGKPHVLATNQCFMNH